MDFVSFTGFAWSPTPLKGKMPLGKGKWRMNGGRVILRGADGAEMEADGRVMKRTGGRGRRGEGQEGGREQGAPRMQVAPTTDTLATVTTGTCCKQVKMLTLMHVHCHTVAPLSCVS